MTNSKLFFGILLLIFLSYISYYFYIGVLNPIPEPGDSWAYHIPIAQTILNGDFLNPTNYLLEQWYYPGSSEIFIALFSILKIPLTLSNIFAIVVLSISLYKLALTFKIKKYNSLIFSLTFCTLTVVTRWMNAISIDVWLAVFFTWIITILEKMNSSNKSYFLLGLSSGMLIGSKYTGIIFLVILLIFYFPKLKKTFNIKRFMIFLIPFSLTGLFWYLRNFISTSNPVFPIPVLGLNGKELFDNYVWRASINYPVDMLNAFYSEYKIWMLLPLLAVGLLIYNYKKRILNLTVIKLFILGIILFIFYFINPSSHETWIMVSSLRYSYPTYIVLLLGLFILTQKYKKENYLFLIITAFAINPLTMSYYPKLSIIYFPLGLTIFILLDEDSKIKKKIGRKVRTFSKALSKYQ